MLITNPMFTTKGETGIARRELQCAVALNLLSVTNKILRSLQMLTALRNLQNPGRDSFIDSNSALGLQRSISELLLQASKEAESRALSDDLRIRSDAFLSGDFTGAALSHAEQRDLPLELIIGSIPSWRFALHPRLYAGILAVPDHRDDPLIAMIDEQAYRLALELSERIGVPRLQPAQPAPDFIVSDLLGLGGDALSHPIHMANFLPDDEGVYKRSQRSVIYRNVFLTRYQVVSAPLARESCGEQLLEHFPLDDHAWLHLITWFRGHDTGHTYFDQYCKSLSGFAKYKRYVLQETLADLFGLLLAIRCFDVAAELCGDGNRHQLAIFIAEMLRFLKRDRQLFPDASAAWFQLSSCLEAKVIKLDSEGKLSGDAQEILNFFRTWFEGLVTNLVQKDSAYLETILTKRCGFTLDGVSPLPNAISYLINKSPQCTEIDPILVAADSIIEQFDPVPEEELLRVRERPRQSGFRYCHRF